MASHDGLKYVLETKKGYIKEDGSFTNKANEALLIDFWKFGFVLDATEIYRKLGFSDQEIIKSGVSFKTIIPSYEARDGIGISYYLLMDYDYENAVNQSRKDCIYYKLYNDDNCLKYKSALKAKTLDYYRNHKHPLQILKADNDNFSLYETNEEDTEILGGTLKNFYSNIGKVFMYSIPLKNPHVEKYFDMEKEELDYYNYFQQRGLIEYFVTRFNEEKFNFGLHFNTEILDIKIIDDKLNIYLNDWNNWNNFQIAKNINSIIRNFYSEREMHITRMQLCNSSKNKW